jgi:hypothetical protein
MLTVSGYTRYPDLAKKFAPGVLEHNEDCICERMKGVLYWRKDSRRASALRFHMGGSVCRPGAAQRTIPSVAAMGRQQAKLARHPYSLAATSI